MPAAGYGFVWPPITFHSDGETIELRIKPSDSSLIEPIRYLGANLILVNAREFERQIGSFIEMVIERLEAYSLTNSELHALWREVCRESSVPEDAFARTIEAQLGMEPGEGPPDLIERMAKLREVAGSGSVSEVALACAGPDPDRFLGEVLELAQLEGLRGQIPIEPDRIPVEPGGLPGQRGWALAARARRELGLGFDAIPDGRMAELLGLECKVFQENATASARRPLSLAVRVGDTESIGFHFRKRNRPGLRFEAARFLADYLLNRKEANWFLTSDTKTARQKLQRAFAAEFLCPIEALKAYLENDYSPSAIEEASQHFGVSELAVESHLANHHLILRDEVRAA